ncbi:hypothetical protein FGO68_gene10268 [Halteria grandinella]|uniref:Uncharacterized protein n=1 Tax=Halteria grandinella TaxID=5974 RepID=A0A8J8T0R3_HALGN|nr:hypothetical protein FGO68_gene10268 [Halteria grandinella]
MNADWEHIKRNLKCFRFIGSMIPPICNSKYKIQQASQLANSFPVHSTTTKFSIFASQIKCLLGRMPLANLLSSSSSKHLDMPVQFTCDFQIFLVQPIKSYNSHFLPGSQDRSIFDHSS